MTKEEQLGCRGRRISELSERDRCVREKTVELGRGFAACAVVEGDDYKVTRRVSNN